MKNKTININCFRNMVIYILNINYFFIFVIFICKMIWIENINVGLMNTIRISNDTKFCMIIIFICFIASIVCIFIIDDISMNFIFVCTVINIIIIQNMIIIRTIENIGTITNSFYMIVIG